MKNKMFRQHSCERKKRFPDREAAFTLLHKWRQNRHIAREHWPFNVYECKYCKGFHIGKKSTDKEFYV